ncbi:riboflavin biosynthesis protein RibF [Thermobaculum terrenum ATCC BAA-798]|uniref:Riboflavin biosynthesis protein n=1 Tax=Thermobaculum terrenum (strain ATCC BAA-798 / CCMEE 7001 / YNP1) TaxID=525904 RepID=D1CFW8_THET1|nr:bifunctional riboflavin kinase/FAD synthetase [Thermobaculum terrenum]ACZ41824.1 riboflavin biosynthesis protein RibF [Thermobaculum terrenum ATCC BAA-798]
MHRYISSLIHERPYREAPGPQVITMGTFDGLHLGHQAIIKKTLAVAEEHGLESTAITFHPHPRYVLSGNKVPQLLPLEDRLDLLADMGINHVWCINFDLELAKLSAKEFFELLSKWVVPAALVVGENFRTGRNREAGVKELDVLGQELGWELISVPTLYIHGQPVSSTRIRHLLTQEGDVESAASLLGRNYYIKGTVVHGEGRGRQLGYPTANLSVSSDLVVPYNGIYYCDAYLDEPSTQPKVAAVSIGTRPTFGGGERTIEAYLLDWYGDLYDRTLKLEFIHRIRDELKFASVEDLIDQMDRDVANIRSLASSRLRNQVQQNR